jgi:hypothetical protein
MQAKLVYVIKFVANMESAVAYHRDRLGLPLKFQSPEWSEFAAGDVTLALHAPSPANPAGSVQFGYAVDDLTSPYEARAQNGIDFSSPPRAQHARCSPSSATTKAASARSAGSADYFFPASSPISTRQCVRPL